MPSEKHPLFRRLSGQAVWTLLEEYGLDEATIDPFMDAYNHWRSVNLERLAPVLTPMPKRPRPAGLRLIHVPEDWKTASPDGPPLPCPHCMALEGRIMALDCVGDSVAPDVLLRLPPFSLGCRMSAIPLWEGDPLLQTSTLEPAHAFSPSTHLLCPSGWLLREPWNKPAT